MKPPTEMLEDFRNHLWACFKHLGLGDPTPAQYAMAERLQSFATDMQLQAGRGFGKSVITACLASWFLLRDPNATIMVVSATGNKAAEFISMTRKILDLVPYCEHLRPGDNTTDNALLLMSRLGLRWDRTSLALPVVFLLRSLAPMLIM